MTKKNSVTMLVCSGGSFYLGKVWDDESPPQTMRDATPIAGGLVQAGEGRIALQVVAPPYGCAEGTIKVMTFGSVDNWVKVTDLSAYDQDTVKGFLERKDKADTARRMASSGILPPRGMSPEDMAQFVKGARG